METALARRLERAFWSWQARTWDELLSPPAVAARVTETVERFSAHAPNGTVLDAACGTGLHAAALRDRGYAVVGLDFAAGMVTRAAAHVPVVRADLADPWPIAPGSVDGVLSVFTLQFFRPASFLARVGECLKQGGVAMIEWPRGDKPLPLPDGASLRLRSANVAKRSSVAIGRRLGLAKVFDLEHVSGAAQSLGLEVIEAETAPRRLGLVLRKS